MKMLMKLVIISVLICFTNVDVTAQQFELKSPKEVKLLDYSSDWYIVQKLGSENECCNSRRFLGELIGFSQDSIEMKVEQLETRRNDTDKSYHSIVKFNTKKEFPIYTLAKSRV